MKFRVFAAVAAVACALIGALATRIEADVTVPWATIGNPGNPPDVTGLGFGAVGNTFSMSKLEVSNSQYVEFLNGVDRDGTNTLALYNSSMSTDGCGGINFNSGAAAGAKYSVRAGRGNNPVVYVSRFDAYRFVNWLQNGQGNGSTETGAYTLLGGTATPSNAGSITRNATAVFFIPTENEWHKAAYYDPAKPGGAGYWDYPTRTDVVPYSDQPPGTDAPTPSNTANYCNDDGLANGYNDGLAVTAKPSYSPLTDNLLSDVGAYTAALSAYGTLDQGGNVDELVETNVAGLVRGGSWYNTNPVFLRADARIMTGGGEYSDLGFRIAAVPEPGCLTVGALAVVALARLPRRVRPD